MDEDGVRIQLEELKRLLVQLGLLRAQLPETLQRLANVSDSKSSSAAFYDISSGIGSWLQSLEALEKGYNSMRPVMQELKELKAEKDAAIREGSSAAARSAGRPANSASGSQSISEVEPILDLSRKLETPARNSQNRMNDPVQDEITSMLDTEGMNDESLNYNLNLDMLTNDYFDI